MDASMERLANDLQSVLDGTLPLADVLSNEKSVSYGDAIKDCFADLHHFVSDSDERASDPWYKEMQESEMRKLILLLRNGGRPERIRKITFLGYSKD
jgi:hypothetical protein